MIKHRMTTLLLAGAFAAPVFAAPPAVTPPPNGGSQPPAAERGAGRRFRNGPGMWMVFSRLSEKERLEMLKLQREDPERFQALMRAKADELFRKREARRAYLRKLAEQCRNAATPEERERLRRQLTEEVEKDFRAHLQANRNQLEDMKRRTARLELELRRREKNMDKAVAAIVEELIKGERPPRPPDSRRFGR